MHTGRGPVKLAAPPRRSIQRLGHDFIDLGASAVFGHSAHHVQGIEVYRGCPIVYGAGGFLDDYA